MKINGIPEVLAHRILDNFLGKFKEKYSSISAVHDPDKREMESKITVDRQGDTHVMATSRNKLDSQLLALSHAIAHHAVERGQFKREIGDEIRKKEHNKEDFTTRLAKDYFLPIFRNLVTNYPFVITDKSKLRAFLEDTISPNNDPDKIDWMKEEREQRLKEPKVPYRILYSLIRHQEFPQHAGIVI